MPDHLGEDMRKVKNEEEKEEKEIKCEFPLCLAVPLVRNVITYLCFLTFVL